MLLWIHKMNLMWSKFRFGPNDFFNPVKIRVYACIDSRYTFSSANFSKRSYALNCVHARNTGMICLNRSAGIALKQINESFIIDWMIKIRSPKFYSLDTYLFAQNVIRRKIAFRQQFHDSAVGLFRTHSFDCIHTGWIVPALPFASDHL